MRDHFASHGSSGEMSRRGSAANVNNHERHAHFDEHQPSPSALSNALAAHAARSNSFSGRDHHRPQLNLDSASTITHTAMSNSPSHPSSQNTSSVTSPLSSSPAATGAHLQQPPTPGSGSALPSPSPRPGDDPNVDFLSQVPSYDVAARGFLGGGVVPISQGLPNYDDVCEDDNGGGEEPTQRRQPHATDFASPAQR